MGTDDEGSPVTKAQLEHAINNVRSAIAANRERVDRLVQRLALGGGLDLSDDASLRRLRDVLDEVWNRLETEREAARQPKPLPTPLLKRVSEYVGYVTALIVGFYAIWPVLKPALDALMTGHK